MTTRKPDDAELEGAVGDELDDSVRVGDRERDAQFRVRARELPEEEGDDGAAGLEATGDPLALGQLVEELLLRGQYSLCVAIEALPCLRRLDPAAGAVEQVRAQTLLERPDLQAHSGLRDAEPLGRL